jgi:hypothetical protein
MALPVKSEVGRGRVTMLQTILDHEEIATDTVDVTQDVTVADAEVGDVVKVSFENAAFLLGVNAYVSARGVVTLQVVNQSGSGADASSETINLAVFHRK